MNIPVQPLSGHDLTGIVMFGGLFLGGALVGIAYVIAQTWLLFKKAELEAALKEQLIQQGRTAEEIERVLKATATDGTQPARSAGGG